jgi:transaldolase
MMLSFITESDFASQVDPRLSWDYDESLKRARRIIQMYEDAGVPKEKVLIKVRIRRNCPLSPLSPLSHVGFMVKHTHVAIWSSSNMDPTCPD